MGSDAPLLCRSFDTRLSTFGWAVPEIYQNKEIRKMGLPVPMAVRPIGQYLKNSITSQRLNQKCWAWCQRNGKVTAHPSEFKKNFLKLLKLLELFLLNIWTESIMNVVTHVTGAIFVQPFKSYFTLKKLCKQKFPGNLAFPWRWWWEKFLLWGDRNFFYYCGNRIFLLLAR